MASGLGHLSFRCTGCGNCCRDLRVPLTHADLKRLVDRTGEPAASIVAWLAPAAVDMTGEPGSFVLLGASERALMTLAHRDGACRFLTTDAACAVYDARPATCALYPFDPSFGRRGGLRRLRLLRGTDCDHAADGYNDPHALRQADERRWAEQRAYVARVDAWNRAQKHRLRLRHAPLAASDFLSFLGFTTESAVAG